MTEGKPDTKAVESSVEAPPRAAKAGDNASCILLSHSLPDFQAMESDPVLKMRMVLRHQREFPGIIRTEINYARTRAHALQKILLAGENSYYGTTPRFIDAEQITVHSAQLFLRRVYTRVCSFAFINRYYDQYEGTRGLNNKVDTPLQVETMIRFFPKILTEPFSPNERGRLYLISFLVAHEKSNVFNHNTITFLPLILKLNIELCKTFQREIEGAEGNDHSRYGLLGGKIPNVGLLGSKNVLRQLSKRWVVETEEQQVLIDRVSLDMLKEIRESFELVHKEDITKFDLVGSLVNDQHETRMRQVFQAFLVNGRRRNRRVLVRVSASYVPDEQRLRYLVGWDPNSLLPAEESGDCNTPFHRYFLGGSYNTAKNNPTENAHIRGFRLLLELGLIYHPKRFGLLFQKSKSGKTPYKMACNAYSNECTTENGTRTKNKVDGIIDEVIALVQEQQQCNVRGGGATSPNTGGVVVTSQNKVPDNVQHEFGHGRDKGVGAPRPRLDTLEALIYAASEDTIDIDGVFFLLRREPSLLPF